MKTPAERRIAIARDLALFMFGLGGIAYQTVTRDVNFVLLAIFTSMTGVPGLTNLVGVLRTSGTASQPSSSALPAQASDSGSSP